MGRNAQARRLRSLPAAAAAETIEVKMATMRVVLGTGRPAIISVPLDITDVEWLGFISASIQARDAMDASRRRERPVSPELVVPSHELLLPT